MTQEIVKWSAVTAAIAFFVTADGLSSYIFEWRSLRLACVVFLLGGAGYLLFGYLCALLPLAAVASLVNTGIVVGAILWGKFVKGQPLDWHYRLVVTAALVTATLAAARPLLAPAATRDELPKR